MCSLEKLSARSLAAALAAMAAWPLVLCLAPCLLLASPGAAARQPPRRALEEQTESLMPAVDGGDPALAGLYALLEPPVTWANAVAGCTRRGHTLASIHTAAEQVGAASALVAARCLAHSDN